MTMISRALSAPVGAGAAERCYVYVQRPDTGQWVTVGRYRLEAGSVSGAFLYAPSYIEAGFTWSIDPVNLPLQPERDLPATRYGGLHDVLRDACPDAWGQALLRRAHGLPENTSVLRYLMLAGNADRWGALAVGRQRVASVAHLASPPLPKLASLVRELEAMADGRPPLDAGLRRRLVQTASVGGARPKATVRDAEGELWLAKPRLRTDPTDIPCLEHVAQCWGRDSGLDFAETILHPAAAGASVVRVRRFDRQAGRRLMCVSAASLLQAEYPGGTMTDARWSYPRLAEELRRIGSPPEDWRELFGRMVFNAVCGNDDDHVRNHAVVYRHEERRWRLSPAFDVVPNPVEMPTRLAMQLSAGRRDISREAVLTDAPRFGFSNTAEAARYLDDLLMRIEAAREDACSPLGAEWRRFLYERTTASLIKLRVAGD
ncbi:MAG: HipA domain-containing protein [Burkholderiaceae bacterium]